MTPQALEPLVGQQYMLLTTYRRNGTPVSTPMHIAVDGDRAFVRTWDPAWKIKRIRNNPEVDVAPSTMRGEPTGPAIHARARVLEGAESAYAARVLARKYPILHGFLIPLVLASMAGSFVFGLAYHFLIPGLDNAFTLEPGAWRTAFRVSAVLLLLIEGTGCLVGVWILSRLARFPGAAERTRSIDTFLEYV